MSDLLKSVFLSAFGIDCPNCTHVPITTAHNEIARLKIKGFGSDNITALINELCRGPKTYLEIGTHQGRSLISAALGNPTCRCIGIDNFSQFDTGNMVRRILISNIVAAGVRNVELYLESFHTAIDTLFTNEQRLRIDVFFYDGDHARQPTFEALNRMYPHLAPTSFIIIDDYNWDAPRDAMNGFMFEHPDFSLAWSIITPAQFSPWHNGIAILERISQNP